MGRIDGERLWGSLMDMAKVGATPGGGSNRVELTDLDKEGRDLFIGWAEASGGRIEMDPIGNLFVFQQNECCDGPAIMVGSHLDTQPYGGRFDGVYGVLCGLELFRLVAERKVTLKKPLVLAVWSNEEGARFSVPNLGARSFTGLIGYEEALDVSDKDGITVRGEVERLGLSRPSIPIKHSEIAGYFEVHIEQGPILQRYGCQVGVVLGINGVSAFDIILNGSSCHTATTPLEMRSDPLLGAAKIIQGVNESGLELEPNGRGSSSWIIVSPNVHNCIANKVHFKADVRHCDSDGLGKAEIALKGIVDKVCSEHGLTYYMANYWRAEPLLFHSDCIDAIRHGAMESEYKWMEIVGGAAHDACSLACIVPTGMVFVPCDNGISHNEAETLDREDALAGAEVLANAIELFDRSSKS